MPYSVPLEICTLNIRGLSGIIKRQPITKVMKNDGLDIIPRTETQVFHPVLKPTMNTSIALAVIFSWGNQIENRCWNSFALQVQAILIRWRSDGVEVRVAGNHLYAAMRRTADMGPTGKRPFMNL